MLILNTELGRRAAYFAKNHIGVQIVTRSGYIFSVGCKDNDRSDRLPSKIAQRFTIG